MKKVNALAFVLLITYLLSGCISPGVDSSKGPNTGMSSSQEFPDVDGPDDSTPPAGLTDDTILNAVETLWFFDLLCKSADEVAEKQNSPITSWDFVTDMDGYDYWYDPSNDVYYLFVEDEYGNGVQGDDICWGILTTISNILPLTDKSPADLLAELSDIFSVRFQWSAFDWEEDYEYFAYMETSTFPVRFDIFTSPDREFDLFSGIQFIAVPGVAAGLNPIENYWFYDLLCRPASEVADKRYSSIDLWERRSGRDGYDHYYDVSEDQTYLFAHKVEDINEADVCEGILASIENCLYIRSQSSGDILAEISEMFFAEFEWSLYEENYCYIAHVETHLFPVDIVIYTDENKEFGRSSIIRFTVPADYVYRCPAPTQD